MTGPDIYEQLITVADELAVLDWGKEEHIALSAVLDMLEERLGIQLASTAELISIEIAMAKSGMHFMCKARLKMLGGRYAGKTKYWSASVRYLMNSGEFAHMLLAASKKISKVIAFDVEDHTAVQADAMQAPTAKLLALLSTLTGIRPKLLVMPHRIKIGEHTFDDLKIVGAG